MSHDGLLSLQDYAGRHGITLSEIHLEFLGRYVDELLRWNRKINLTGPSSMDRIFHELVLDSIIPVPYISDTGHMLDVGSGAGFPAIPIKICKPLLQAHLVESNTRKCSFLKQVIRILELHSIDVIEGRIETGVNLIHPEGYDTVTARAFAGPEYTIEICSPFMARGGNLILFLGRRAEKELLKDSSRMDEYLLAVSKIIRYSVPGSNSLRSIILLKKG